MLSSYFLSVWRSFFSHSLKVGLLATNLTLSSSESCSFPLILSDTLVRYRIVGCSSHFLYLSMPCQVLLALTVSGEIAVFQTAFHLSVVHHFSLAAFKIISSPCQKPDMGLDPRTPGSQLESKADAQVLNHPGAPTHCILVLKLPFFAVTCIIFLILSD